MTEPAPMATCGFCGKDATRGVEGPNGKYACWDCLLKARDVIAFMSRTYTCSFCMETVPSTSVVEGPEGLYMCSSCIDSGIKLLNR